MQKRTSLHNKTLGSKGESIALEYLRNKGLSILETNWTAQWAEIDIIAKRGETLVFVEVKTKTGMMKGKPYEAVTYGKLQKLMRSAQLYILKKKRPETKYAVDVVSIIISTTGQVIEIQHFDNIDLG